MKSKLVDIKENGIVATVILVVVTVVITAALAAVNYLTEPVISENARAAADESRIRVFSTAASFEDVSGTYITPDTKKIRSVALALDAQGDPAGLVVESYENGYSGAIVVMTGITVQRELIGLIVLSNTETPGLGTRVALDSFTGRFLGGRPGLAFTFKKEDDGLNTVDAITASTISSTAVLRAVNDALSFADGVFARIDEGGAD